MPKIGYKQSLEHRRKIGLACTGIKRSKEPRVFKSKICPHCKIEKPFSDYPVSCSYKGRITYWLCKPCKTKYHTTYASKRNRVIDPLKARARSELRRAVKEGRIKRLPCFCGETRVEGHHHKGYERSYWLDVMWLCPKHHVEEHKKLRMLNFKDTK